MWKTFDQKKDLKGHMSCEWRKIISSFGIVSAVETGICYKLVLGTFQNLILLKMHSLLIRMIKVLGSIIAGFWEEVGRILF